MNIKKIFSIILCLLCLFALSACGGEKTENPSESPNKSGKILVVYYSATGNTKEVAEYISYETGGELFELLPVEPYSDEDLDWTDENSRVVYVHNNPDQRRVELSVAKVENFSEYDTVFIGYPIWWGIAAWPVGGFIEANDFSGKTVIPFCTSASSDLGNSGKLLQEAAGTGNWLDGIRFSSAVSETEITEWLKTIGY